MKNSKQRRTERRAVLFRKITTARLLNHITAEEAKEWRACNRNIGELQALINARKRS